MTFLGMWARAFAATVVVEAAVAVPALGARWPRGRRLGAALLGQLATHPAVWFIFPELHLPRPLFLFLAESWAVLVEALVYRFTLPGVSYRRAAAVSVLANAASVVAGRLLF